MTIPPKAEIWNGSTHLYDVEVTHGEVLEDEDAAPRRICVLTVI